MRKSTMLVGVVGLAVFVVLAQDAGKFTDKRDGKTYKTVRIGSQVWFARNLDYETEGSKCYENSPDSCAKYGHLYDYSTAATSCPDGWRLPNNEDWAKLFRFVDGNKDTGFTEYKFPYYMGDRKTGKTGKRLKAVSGWKSNGNGTDDFGFSALPGGRGSSHFGFSAQSGWHVRSHIDPDAEGGNNGYWWAEDGYSRYLIYQNGYIFQDCCDKSVSQSVRCLQDTGGQK